MGIGVVFFLVNMICFCSFVGNNPWCMEICGEVVNIFCRYCLCRKFLSVLIGCNYFFFLNTVLLFFLLVQILSQSVYFFICHFSLTLMIGILCCLFRQIPYLFHVCKGVFRWLGGCCFLVFQLFLWTIRTLAFIRNCPCSCFCI